MEKSSQLADFSSKGLPTGSNARCGTVKKIQVSYKRYYVNIKILFSYLIINDIMWLLVFIDGNDALTNTPILFSTNWDAGDSKSEFVSITY